MLGCCVSACAGSGGVLRGVEGWGAEVLYSLLNVLMLGLDYLVLGPDNENSESIIK